MRSGKFLVILALVLTTGAHWAALQTVAWTTMLAVNLRTHSVTEAVASTFDGKHPCCLCKAIAAAKKAQKQSEAVAPALKMEFTPLAGRITLFPPAHFELLPQSDSFAESLFS
jgi:hypothetical protein